MSAAATRRPPAGYFTLTLHAHLPYVVNHGTWPHGMEWLLEAASETYLPLLRVFANLLRDGIAFRCNLVLSPILLEQLAHPVFRAELPKYLQRKLDAAREDEAYFAQTGEPHYADVARFWQKFFQQSIDELQSLEDSLISGFRKYSDAGLLDILTGAATHCYMPLLGTDESISAQVKTAVATHRRHLGVAPRGIWLPECGYRPAGQWDFPVLPVGATEPWHPFYRAGIEQMLSESGLEYFFVDSHLIEHSARNTAGSDGTEQLSQPARELYQPYSVAGDYTNSGLAPVSVFPRDPRTGVQVWSGDLGYPGDPLYLDFHKKRWPGGHRYWQVTGSTLGMESKTPYHPRLAAERAVVHANHFVDLVYEALSTAESAGASESAGLPPILTAPFDAELFGHWWFEGPMWLENVARSLARRADVADETDAAPILPLFSSEYLRLHPPAESIALGEGSWGSNGDNSAWLNPETNWTWAHIYPAEAAIREISTEPAWRESELGTRIVKQLCRELLLMESSDWQFLITTASARDYAEKRFSTHNDTFAELLEIWQSFSSGTALSDDTLNRLAEIETRDSVFHEIDPGLWSRRV